MERHVADETYGTTIRRVYRRPWDSHTIHMIQVERARWKSIKSFFCTVLLPHGYPESVSKDYLSYQIWDSIQAFASSITIGISTHAVLKGVGVGDGSATTLAATMTWIMKDGFAMVGRIVFSWFQGTKFDSECKKWRLFADVLNDIAMFLDLISAYFKGYVFFIICLSGLLKSIVGVAGGATRAALTQHQARNNNMADVSAKDGSQETLVNLAALVCSLVLIPIVVHDHLLVWSLYILMTSVHLIANYFAVKSVIMETFNKERFQIYTEQYFETHMECPPSVEQVNKRENVFLLPVHDKVTIHLGVSLSNVIEWKSSDEIADLFSLYEKCDYFLTFSKQESEKTNIYICLRTTTAQVQLEAMYQACIIANMYSTTNFGKQQGFMWNQFTQSSEWIGNQAHDTKNPVENFSKKFTEMNFSKFKKNLEACGWRTDTVIFDTDVWHVNW